jgi:2'-5' RNA ligase
MRVFFGTYPPPDVARAVVAMRDRARALVGDKGARWEHDDKLHLTLQFLGEQTEERTARAIEIARTIKHAPFELSIGGYGVFPNERRPHVLWLGVQGDVAPLANALGAALKADGFAIEERAYHPHVTIARLRGAKLPPLPELPHTASFRVDRFVLLESKGGAYHVREEFTLG